MSDRTAIRQTRKREAILWAIPIVVGLLGVLVGFVVANARPDRFEHTVTLVSAHDGRTSLRDNRDLALELLRAELNNNPPEEGIGVDLESRLGAVLDITVTASNQATATQVAESLGAIAVERLGASSIARFTEGINASEAAVAELNAEIAATEAEIDSLARDALTERGRLERDRNSLADSRNELERQIVSAQSQIGAARAPITLSSSVARGTTSQPRRIAGLFGAAAGVSAVTARRP